MSGASRSDDEGDRRAGDVPEGQLGLGRLFAFTDGVFAIAVAHPAGLADRPPAGNP